LCSFINSSTEDSFIFYFSNLKWSDNAVFSNLNILSFGLTGKVGKSELLTELLTGELTIEFLTLLAFLSSSVGHSHEELLSSWFSITGVEFSLPGVKVPMFSVPVFWVILNLLFLAWWLH